MHTPSNPSSDPFRTPFSYDALADESARLYVADFLAFAKTETYSPNGTKSCRCTAAAVSSKNLTCRQLCASLAVIGPACAASAELALTTTPGHQP